MLEQRHRNLAKLLQKNENWLWLGPNSLLGDPVIDQYAGLKIFIRYILDNRVSILDNREDRGVDFIATGDNPLCINFIKYLQRKAEEEQDEKKKEQYAWMVNRSEAMMQMKDPGLGIMNDGIFLAYAFTLFKLGETASPKVEVDEYSIVSLLEDGYLKCRQDDPSMGKIIDRIENRQPPTLTPAGGEPMAPYAPTAPQGEVGEGGEGEGVSGYEGGGEPISYTKREFGRREVPGKAKEKSRKPEAPQEKGREAEPEEEPEELMPEVPTEEGGEELLPKTFAGTPGPIGVGGATGGIPVAKGRAKTVERGRRYVPKLSKLKVVPVGGKKRKRKKQKGPLKGVEKQKQRPQYAPLPPVPTLENIPIRNVPLPKIPSGGWKIAKKAGKIIFGSSVGAGTIWAAASSPEATAKVFAFIHLFF